MPKLILSPCGTSLLTNKAKDFERNLITNHANAKTEEAIAAGEERRVLEERLKAVEGRLDSADYQQAARMSAELNSIIKIYDGKIDPPNDTHILLHTDTWLGKKTAQLVESWLRGRGFTDVQMLSEPGLSTAKLDDFQNALSGLVEWCSETLPGYRQAQYKIIFNLTGGFKSVQGFLQTLGMFYADEIVYIFEQSESLLRIPRLPVRIEAEEYIQKHLQKFRRLGQNLPVEDQDLRGIPETLLTRAAGLVDLSPWGRLVWDQAKEQIYQKKIYDAPSSKIKFGPRFLDSVEDLPGDRRLLVNKRTDQLAKYQEQGVNLKSLDFKQLRGNPCPPATHEMDAWSDKDAQRIFCHYEGDVVVLDRLDKGLH